MIDGEINLQFRQLVVSVEPQTPKSKPMRTSPTVKETDTEQRLTSTSDQQSSTETSETGLSTQERNTGEETSKEDESDPGEEYEEWKENPYYYDNEPVGGVLAHPVTSEAPQVSTFSVEADKVTASKIAEDGGTVGTKPVHTTFPREANEGPTSLTEGPPHGLHIYDEGENGKCEPSNEEPNDNDEDQGASYEPKWGRERKVNHEEELKYWQETNTDTYKEHAYQYSQCQQCGISKLHLRETTTTTCRQCKIKDNETNQRRSPQESGKHQGDDEE
jgi:hypothetical protein